MSDVKLSDYDERSIETDCAMNALSVYEEMFPDSEFPYGVRQKLKEGCESRKQEMRAYARYWASYGKGSEGRNEKWAKVFEKVKKANKTRRVQYLKYGRKEAETMCFPGQYGAPE